MECPYCGAVLKINPEKASAECPFCEKSISFAQLTKIRVKSLGRGIGVDKDSDEDGIYDSALDTEDIESLPSDKLVSGAELALITEKFSTAKEYADELIRRDPTFAEAYLYRLLAENKASQKEVLAEAKPFSNCESYRLFMKFASEALKTEICAYALAAEKHADDMKCEEIYQDATSKYNLSRSANVYLEAAHLFDSINHYKDSRAKAADCKERARAIEKKEKTLALLKKIIPLIIVAAIILTITCIVISSKRAHNPENIEIELIDMSAKYKAPDNSYGRTEYFVFFDFKITNNTGEDISSIEVISYFSDKNGRQLGTLTSMFGGYSSPINLEVGKSQTREIYLSTRYPEDDGFFSLLYDSSLSDFTVTHTILSVDFSDGTIVTPE